MCKISVIIPVYNSSSYLSEALKSVLLQTMEGFEVIVVDDGSTDGSRQIVNEFIRKFPDKIEYIYQENKGPATARNTAIKNARGEFIAFLDADDVWLPQKLEKQIHALETQPSGVGFATCLTYTLDENGSRKGVSPKITIRNKKKIIRKLVIRNFLGGTPTMLIRKKCFDEAGFFDENLRVAEDWDMWLRLCQKYDFICINEPLVEIRIHQGGQSYFAQKNLENELQFLLKTFSSLSFRKLFYLKSKAYSYRYFCAAWAFLNSGDRVKAKEYIIKSLWRNPLYFIFHTDMVGLLVRIMCGDKRWGRICRIF